MNVEPVLGELELPHPNEGIERESLGPEPWYYGFITGYAWILFWFGLAWIVLNGGGATLMLLIDVTRSNHPAFMMLAVVCAVGTLLVAIGWLFLVALVLLLVDAARTLRRIRQNTHR